MVENAACSLLDILVLLHSEEISDSQTCDNVNTEMMTTGLL